MTLKGKELCVRSSERPVHTSVYKHIHTRITYCYTEKYVINSGGVIIVIVYGKYTNDRAPTQEKYYEHCAQVSDDTS